MSTSETTNKFSIVDLPDLPESVDNAAKNLTNSLSKNIGQTLGDAWLLVFGGISHAADKRRAKYDHALKAYNQELSDAVAAIPSEKQVEPSIQITAQALENSKYCIEEPELRNMFTSLISKSMNTDYCKDIHPSFAEIIKQMSVLDAHVIESFKHSARTQLPLCRYILQKDKGYTVLLENVFLGYRHPDLYALSISISSLVRLGLLKISDTECLVDDTKDWYQPFKEHLWFQNLQCTFPNNEISILKQVVILTPLGQSFSRVCIPD